MAKQEEIRSGMLSRILLNTALSSDRALTLTDSLLRFQDSQGVVIKVNGELPYKWSVILETHSYSPYKKFTTYALWSKSGKMFGYIQRYQSLTGYKCFERKEGENGAYKIYLGDADFAHSYKGATTLEGAREILIEHFLHSKDNPDGDIPAGYVAVESLVKEDKDGLLPNDKRQCQ